jgi:uncharacterized protein RhaS with RHS repeats
VKTKLHRWMTVGCLFMLWASAWPVHAFYNPTTGRWLSRDPIGERGGVKLYSLVANAPTLKHDILGLSDESENWKSDGIEFSWKVTSLGHRPGNLGGKTDTRIKKFDSLVMGETHVRRLLFT